MFQATKSKLEDSYIIYDQLIIANNAYLFKSLFNSFLNSSRSITYALQKEGDKISDFKDWYLVKQEEMKNDQLLRFIHEARTEDFHEGKHRLIFKTHIKNMSMESLGAPPDRNVALSINELGPSWIVNKGTSSEKVVPIVDGGNYTIIVSINNPPQFHKGILIFNHDPRNICKLTLDYMSSLVHEAKEKFK